MRQIELNELVEFAGASGIEAKVDQSSSPFGVRFRRETCVVYVGEFADAASAAFGCAREFLRHDLPADFSGAALWIYRVSGSEAGWGRLFDRLRISYGLVPRGDAAQGGVYVFDAHEWADLQMFLGVVMAFGWDAFVIPKLGQYILNVTNDQMVDVALPDQVQVEKWLPSLEGMNFAHSPAFETRFCTGKNP